MILKADVARVFTPLLQPARQKGAWGGRGSGKSHYFAQQLVIECLTKPGTRAVCIREVQRTLRDSSKRLIEDKIQQLGAGKLFTTLTTESTLQATDRSPLWVCRTPTLKA